MAVSADGKVNSHYVYVSLQEVAIMAVSADGRVSSHYDCVSWREGVAIMAVSADGRANSNNGKEMCSSLIIMKSTKNQKI